MSDSVSSGRVSTAASVPTMSWPGARSNSWVAIVLISRRTGAGAAAVGASPGNQEDSVWQPLIRQPKTAIRSGEARRHGEEGDTIMAVFELKRQIIHLFEYTLENTA